MSNRDRNRKHSAKARRKRRAGARKRVAETTLAIIDRLLLRMVPIQFNGKEQKITALKAIILQLTKKQAKGDNHASRVLQKYQELAPVGTDAPLRIAFLESEYSETLAAPMSEGEHE